MFTGFIWDIEVVKLEDPLVKVFIPVLDNVVRHFVQVEFFRKYFSGWLQLVHRVTIVEVHITSFESREDH